MCISGHQGEVKPLFSEAEGTNWSGMCSLRCCWGGMLWARLGLYALLHIVVNL